MKLKKNAIKIIFGLKLKQIRQNKGLSLSELASLSSMSISYLNEIESGKKYPKTDKIASLSEALNVSYDSLVSIKLTKYLSPIGELLESNILEQLPLDHYGIDINKLIVLMSNAPMQLSALVATLIELAKSSEMSRSAFSRTALRIYKELNNNYFEDIENKVEEFTKKYKVPASTPISYKRLKNILVTGFNYKVDETSLSNFSALRELRATVQTGKPNILFLNNNLSQSQKSFIIGKELAYNFLGMEDRSYSYSNYKLDTFDQLLNNFNASYFSTALKLPKQLFIADTNKLFSKTKWQAEYLLKLLDKYTASPEMFFQRLTNLASKYFNLHKFFFLKFNKDIASDSFQLSKEVRLNIERSPGGYQTNEHYCRRWISIDVLNNLEQKISKTSNFNNFVPGILRSKFHESNDKFLCVSVAKPSKFLTGKMTSVTLGFFIDEKLKKRIKFWNDSAISEMVVNDTCEKCVINNCKQRVAPPLSIEQKEKLLKMEKAIEELKFIGSVE